MTREEYIEFANALKNNYTIDFDKLPEFCDLAISAISAKGEYIKKSELFDKTVRRNSIWNEVTNSEGKGLKEIVNDLPAYSFPDSAENKEEWISVSKRLPEEDGDYMLWGKVTEYDEEEYRFIGSYDSGCEKFGVWEMQYDRTTLGCLGSEFLEYNLVSAWQPLPEDYKGEREEK